MAERDNNQPSHRNPNVQRSNSIGGGKLHYSYTGNEVKIKNSRDESNQPRLSSSSTSRLQRQTTLDPNVYLKSSISSSPNTSIPSYEHDSRETKLRSTIDSSINAKPPETTSSYNVSNYYNQRPLSSHTLSSKKDVTLETSIAPSLAPHSSTSSISQHSIEKRPPFEDSAGAYRPKPQRQASYSHYDPGEYRNHSQTSFQITSHLLPTSSQGTQSFSQSNHQRVPQEAVRSDTSVLETKLSHTPMSPPPHRSMAAQQIAQPQHTRSNDQQISHPVNERDLYHHVSSSSKPLNAASPLSTIHSSFPVSISPQMGNNSSLAYQSRYPVSDRETQPTTTSLQVSSSLTPRVDSVQQSRPIHQPSSSSTYNPYHEMPDRRSRRHTTTVLPNTLPSSTIPPTADNFHRDEPSPNSRDRRQTTTIPCPVFTQKSAFVPVKPGYSTSSSRPLSINDNLQARNFSQSRFLTIGYTDAQDQDIMKAKELFLADQKRYEAERLKKEELKAKIEAQRREDAERRAVEETRKKKEEAERKAAEEAKRKREEAARLKAEEEARRKYEKEERLRAEEARRAAEAEEDKDVAKFIINLEQRIKESRESKNLMGALVGRQNQNHAKIAENLTNAPMNEIDVETKIEGHDVVDQKSPQKDADCSEENRFLKKVKNMKTDCNANRKKYAEHFYEDTDSEIHSSDSRNSFLSIVFEEDGDNSSVNNNVHIPEPQINTLQPSVITYIHDLVDGILSSIDKTDIAKLMDTQQKQNRHDEDLYANDSNYNYYNISDTAKQFFTPQSSPIDNQINDFYND